MPSRLSMISTGSTTIAIVISLGRVRMFNLIRTYVTQIDQAYSMTYLQLITRHLERNDASAELITVVEDYLEHAHPHDEPPWFAEFDEICQRAVAFANSKAERLRKH